MSRGFAEYKNRNSASRARYHNRAALNAFAQTFKSPEIKRLVRQDLRTGKIEVINRSTMNCEILWCATFQRWNCLGMESSIAWAELEKGATLYTEKAMFWLETNLAAMSKAA